MKRKKTKDPKMRGRLQASFFIIALAFFILIIQLFRIMIMQKDFLSAKAESQSINQKKIAPKRGSILDRNGRDLVVSADVYKVSLDLLTLDKYAETIAIKKDSENNKNKSTFFSKLSSKFKKQEANESKVDEAKKNDAKKDIANKIGNALGIDPTKVLESFDKKDGNGNLIRGLSLARKVEKQKIDKLREVKSSEKYNFMIIENDTERYYANGKFLAHVLGNVNMDGEGVFGVEKYYDKDLTGIPGVRIAELDRNSYELPYEDPVYTEPINGKNVMLTIDENIQFIAEQVAQTALETNKAKGVTIVVSNPKNGEILAMVNKPDFDPNDPRKGITDNETLQQLWRNKAVSDVFEPGSTFKIATTAAALEEGLTNANDDFYCNGYTVVNGVKIRCWKGEGHGAEKLVDILKNSCNPGFMELGKRLGQAKMNEYIYKFGFGKPTGIDLPAEAAGIIKDADKMSPIDLATISFGQSDAATSIQLLAALNAVMNNGVYTTPHIMKEIYTTDKNGNKEVDKKYEEKNSRQVISKKTANDMAAYLEQVVSKGSGHDAYIENYGIAGKTGTAEKITAGGKGYAEGKYVSSFIGAAPYDDPKISLFIAIDEPKGEYFGGLVASPVAKELFQQIFNQLAIRSVQ